MATKKKLNYVVLPIRAPNVEGDVEHVLYGPQVVLVLKDHIVYRYRDFATKEGPPVWRTPTGPVETLDTSQPGWEKLVPTILDRIEKVS